ncbi:DMT family transporter [Croceiramulus getboli]|nr:EamA family transporter [Flavobacteriaceae bacterium YJPT1-3]
MNENTRKWLYLGILSLVWGSSFILIKKSLIGLSPIQLGALRTLFAASFLFVVGFKSMRKIKRAQWKWVAISGFAGTFFPAFLFAFAETEIDSAIASILNATTPLVTLILGALIFAIGFSRNQLIGVLVGLVGCVALIYAGASLNPNQNYWYAGLVLIASLLYATNVNIIKRYMQEIPAMAIANGNFLAIFIPALGVLIYSGFFKAEVIEDPQVQESLMYVGVLAVVGTGVAKVLFNRLVQISSPVFATSVTYTIPIVALFWGFLDGETFSIWELLATALIITGVYLGNRKRKSK